MDSLQLALKNLPNGQAGAKDDTSRIIILSALSEQCEVTDIMKYAEPCVQLCEKGLSYSKTPTSKTFYLKHLAITLNNIGYLTQQQGNISKALEYFFKCLEIQEEIKDKTGIARSFNNIGSIYDNMGDISRALEYYHSS